ncbi:secretory pathway protein Sec39-domain-containing protein [Infundibulicybe gibba]|nr:secretory pathway protein Sec39-domain-containing protein [Infundibulicybe gibba]
MASSSSDTYTYWSTLTDDDLTVEIVQKTLNGAQDDVWVTAACLDRLLDDISLQRALLDVGISRTEDVIRRSMGALNGTESMEAEAMGDSADIQKLTDHFQAMPADAQLCHMRAVLLHRLDLLNTYVQICATTPTGQNSDDYEYNDPDELSDEWDDDPWADGGDEPATKPATKSRPPPISLSTFLLQDLLTSACRLATMHWFDALQVMLERHGSALWQFRFIILDGIPEHTQPSAVRGILPGLNPSLEYENIMSLNSCRPERDFSELPHVQIALGNSGIVFFYSENIPLPDLEGCAEPLTAEELATWYTNHVDRIMSSTGMVDLALAYIQHGASQGIPGLDSLGEELSLLSRLVYDAPQGHVLEDWTLERWRKMDPPSVLRAYLAHSTPDSLPSDINRLVMPYLFVLEAHAERAGAPDPTLPNRLLYDYILSAPLDLVAVIFDSSKPTLPAAQRLLRNDEDIVRLALACLYGSNSLNQWSTMSRIFECLPVWEVTGEDEDTDADVVETTIASLGNFVTPSTARPQCGPHDLLVFFKPLPVKALSRALDMLDVHLESGEILSRWSVAAPLRWFLQSSGNAKEQLSWANRMARRAGGSDDRLTTQEDWEWLLEDMLKLCGNSSGGLRGAFGLVPHDGMIRIFLNGLLSSGNFKIAQHLLRSKKIPLDSSAIEEICLTCSREFYDNAPSGNYKFGDMKLAYDCLDVPPPSDRILQEKEFIEATSRISSFNISSRPGVPISPIEIRLTRDRLSLISRVLSSNNDAYKHTEVILDLAYKLGFRNNAVAEVKVLAMLADTALQTEDFTRAYELSERMVEAVSTLRARFVIDDPTVIDASEVCWVACFQLGRQPEFVDLEKKLLLLGRALELCPADKIHDVLTVWRRLEQEHIRNCEERLSGHQRGAPSRAQRPLAANAAASLKTRLKDFHMPSPPLLSTPDAAALASRTFRSVAANFPFSVGSRGRSQLSERDEEESGSHVKSDSVDVSAQATRVFQKGIGWLIGADDE